MRMKKLERDEAFAVEVLKTAPFATLAMADDGGRPYCVPVNTVWHDGVLYFHCAGVGEKWEILKNDPCVCLTPGTGAPGQAGRAHGAARGCHEDREDRAGGDHRQAECEEVNDSHKIVNIHRFDRQYKVK